VVEDFCSLLFFRVKNTRGAYLVVHCIPRAQLMLLCSIFEMPAHDYVIDKTAIELARKEKK
jgi:hypothetical protein